MISRKRWRDYGPRPQVWQDVWDELWCATCRRLGIDPWQYLRAVFAAIANGLSARELAADWTPWAWAQKQTQQPNAQQPLAVAS